MAARVQTGGRRMTLEAVAENTNYGTTASGSSFYAAMRILPRAQREAMFQIYSFCRKVDDIADSDGPRPERVAQIPLELLPYREAFRAPPPVSQPMVEAQAAPRSPAVPTEGSEHSGSGGPSAAGSAFAAVPAATDPAPNSPGEVVIRATADSWIQIRDARQSVLLTRVLKAGESCRAPDRPGLSMRTGNAGGLEITVDGVPAPPIGGRGMVRRNVALDGHALLAGSAVRN